MRLPGWRCSPVRLNPRSPRSVLILVENVADLVVFRLPRHPPVRASAVYGSREGRILLWHQVGDKVLIVGIVSAD